MSDFHQAARSGNLPLLQRLLDAGAEVDSYEPKSRLTPLMAACLSQDADLATVRFLLDQGADVHARDKKDLPLIALAIEKSRVEKIRLLIERDADVHYRSPQGYTLIIKAAYLGREDVIDLLLAAGAPVDGQSDWKESALSVLSRTGRFEMIRRILDHGADPAPLEWTALHRAIALGTYEEVISLLDRGADPETVDFWSRTAFLLSLHTGDIEKAALLLARGANRNATGRCEKPPLHYPIDRDDDAMLQWLIDAGFDFNQTDQFATTALQQAVERSATRCFQRLLAAGADCSQPDKNGDPLIQNASHPEIIRTLIDLGADAARLEAEPLRNWIGLGTRDELQVSEREFRQNRTRRFGNANPQRMNVPFWNAMVRCGWDGYRAAKQFADDDTCEDPVWCHQRFGMSLTRLPDGRFVQIAGEHEDHYDPDFCIYNDVVLHDGQGGFEILSYPEAVFPPTDFHSATLVGEWIYLIGNLGYLKTRIAHELETPVYRLHTDTWQIERVITTGPSPGWIHSHAAKHLGGSIRISGGKKYSVDDTGAGRIDEHTGTWSFDLQTASWQLLNP